MTDDETRRRMDDEQRGRIEEYMRQGLAWQQTWERNYREDQERHRQTHADLYGKVATANIRIASITTGIVVVWKIAEHFVR